jgi:hypothetical protein
VRSLFVCFLELELGVEWLTLLFVLLCRPGDSLRLNRLRTKGCLMPEGWSGGGATSFSAHTLCFVFRSVLSQNKKRQTIIEHRTSSMPLCPLPHPRPSVYRYPL